MEGVREIMTFKKRAKYLFVQAGLKRSDSCSEGYMRTVRIFFLFGNISEQFGYGQVIRHFA